jgi:hypothetical protein
MGSISVRRRHPIRSLAVLVIAVALAAAPGAPAHAGGWAVASVDPLPAVVAGRTVPVGFTVLQHGKTPVALDDRPDGPVGIELVLDEGIRFFAAVYDGRPGHHVATVPFPDEVGAYVWRVRMGIFGVQELGAVDVTGRTGGTWWPNARWALVALAGALTSVALADAALGQRRRHRREAVIG